MQKHFVLIFETNHSSQVYFLTFCEKKFTKETKLLGKCSNKHYGPFEIQIGVYTYKLSIHTIWQLT